MGDIKPTEKVQAGLYSGAAGTVLMWWLAAQGVDVPPAVSLAIGVLLSGLGAWLKTEGTGWLRRKRGSHAAD